MTASHSHLALPAAMGTKEFPGKRKHGGFSRISLAFFLTVVACCGGEDSGSGDAGGEADGGSAGEADAGLPQVWAPNFVRVENSGRFEADFCGLATDVSICSWKLVAGGCELTVCPAPTCFIDAGAITVEAPGGTSTGTFDSGGDERYPHYTGTGAVIWNEGDPVRFMGEGAEVPAFDVTVDGPGEVSDLEIVLEQAPSGAFPVDPAQPLEVRWSGGGDVGEIAMRMWYFDLYEYKARRLRCAFDLSAGDGAVPVEALAEFAKDDPDDVFDTLYLEVSTESRKMVQLGDRFLVAFQARGAHLYRAAEWK